MRQVSATQCIPGQQDSAVTPFVTNSWSCDSFVAAIGAVGRPGSTQHLVRTGTQVASALQSAEFTWDSSRQVDGSRALCRRLSTADGVSPADRLVSPADRIASAKKRRHRTPCPHCASHRKRVGIQHTSPVRTCIEAYLMGVDVSWLDSHTSASLSSR